MRFGCGAGEIFGGAGVPEVIVLVLFLVRQAEEIGEFVFRGSGENENENENDFWGAGVGKR